MLLPKMTPAEMRSIMLLDLDEVKERTEKVVPKLTREVLKRKLKNQRKVFYRKFTSKNKSKWLIRIVKLKGKKYEFEAYPCCFFHDKKGFRLVDLNCDTNQLDIYNGHFFKRYDERMGLNIENHLELAKWFFQQNTGNSYILTKKELQPKVLKISSQIPEGLKLGIHDKNQNAIIWNTFISHMEYKSNQKELKEKTLKRIKLKRAIHYFDGDKDPHFINQLIGT